MYCAWRIPAHLRCTQCSILLHLMDICFLTCNEPTPALCTLSVRTVVKLCTLGVLGFLNCDDICMCVVNKQFEVLEFVFEMYLIFTAGSVSLCCVCSHVVVFGLSMRLSCYPMWMRWLL